MAAFDFLATHPMYVAEGGDPTRLSLRHDIPIQPYRAELEGARVLDLGSHGGRWRIAFAQVVASSVLGVVGRTELQKDFARLPDSPAKACVTMKTADIFE